MYHSIRSVDFHLRNNTEVVLSRKEWADIRKELLGDSIDNTAIRRVKLHKFIEIFSHMLFKEELFDSDNLLTICRGCGKKAWLPNDIKHEKKCVVSIAINTAQKLIKKAQNSPDNTERVKLFCTTNHACKFKGIKKQCTYRCIYAEPKGKQDKA